MAKNPTRSELKTAIELLRASAKDALVDAELSYNRNESTDLRETSLAWEVVADYLEEVCRMTPTGATKGAYSEDRPLVPREAEDCEHDDESPTQLGPEEDVTKKLDRKYRDAGFTLVRQLWPSQYAGRTPVYVYKLAHLGLETKPSSVADANQAAFYKSNDWHDHTRQWVDRARE